MRESRIRQIIREETTRVLESMDMHGGNDRTIEYKGMSFEGFDNDEIAEVIKKLKELGIEMTLEGSERQWREFISEYNIMFGGGAGDDLYDELKIK